MQTLHGGVSRLVSMDSFYADARTFRCTTSLKKGFLETSQGSPRRGVNGDQVVSGAMIASFNRCRKDGIVPVSKMQRRDPSKAVFNRLFML